MKVTVALLRTLLMYLADLHHIRTKSIVSQHHVFFIKTYFWARAPQDEWRKTAMLCTSSQLLRQSWAALRTRTRYQTTYGGPEIFGQDGNFKI